MTENQEASCEIFFDDDDILTLATRPPLPFPPETARLSERDGCFLVEVRAAGHCLSLPVDVANVDAWPEVVQARQIRIVEFRFSEEAAMRDTLIDLT